MESFFSFFGATLGIGSGILTSLVGLIIIAVFYDKFVK
jgi:hypothetical protein